MGNIDKRIETLKTELKQAMIKKQQIEARKRAAELKMKRSDDTRRKILVGALVLKIMEENEETRTEYLEILGKYLTRPKDRALFNLPTPLDTLGR